MGQYNEQRNVYTDENGTEHGCDEHGLPRTQPVRAQAKKERDAAKR